MQALERPRDPLAGRRHQQTGAERQKLDLAAESGCFMLSIGFESISRATLTSVHKHVNRPENFAKLVEKIHGYGMLVFGLFIFGFDTDDQRVFDETGEIRCRCQLRHVRLLGADALSRYDPVVPDEEAEPSCRSTGTSTIRATSSTGRRRCRAPAPPRGTTAACERFYAPSSPVPASLPAARLTQPAPVAPSTTTSSRRTPPWPRESPVAKPTEAPATAPAPPILPVDREWRRAILEAAEEPRRAGSGGGGSLTCFPALGNAETASLRLRSSKGCRHRRSSSPERRQNDAEAIPACVTPCGDLTARLLRGDAPSSCARRPARQGCFAVASRMRDTAGVR